MRVLIIDSILAEAKKVAEMAVSHGHVAHAVVGGQAAITIAQRIRPDVVILDSTLDLHARSSDFIPQLRAQSLQVYVVLALGKNATFEPATAAASGVDDIIQRPYELRELLMRMIVADRLLHAQSRLGQPPTNPQLHSLERKVHLPDWAERMSSVGAWVKLSETLREAFSGFLGTTATQCAAPFPTTTFVFSGTLSATAQCLELEVVLVTDKTSAQAIAAGLLGPDGADEASTNDMMMEMVNTAIGAARAELLGDGLDFTVGIPVRQPVKTVSSTLPLYELVQSVGYDIAGSRLGVIAGLRLNGFVTVLGEQVKEGMVIARDVVNERGVLVVRAGTRITATAAAHLVRLAPKLQIEVMSSAA